MQSFGYGAPSCFAQTKRHPVRLRIAPFGIATKTIHQILVQRDEHLDEEAPIAQNLSLIFPVETRIAMDELWPDGPEDRFGSLAAFGELRHD
jgi:hypothetical protein